MDLIHSILGRKYKDEVKSVYTTTETIAKTTTSSTQISLDTLNTENFHNVTEAPMATIPLTETETPVNFNINTALQILSIFKNSSKGKIST